jgi:hypothetical protein
VVLSGKIDQRKVTDGRGADLRLLFHAVWRNEAGAWRLVSLQTALPPPVEALTRRPTAQPLPPAVPTVASAVLAVLLPILLAAAPPAPAPPGPAWNRHVIDNSSHGADGTKLGDLNGDGLLDITTAWEEGGITRVYLNPGPALAKTPWPQVTVGSTVRAEDAVFADLDGDGFPDIVSSTEAQSQQVLVHWAPRSPAALLDPGAWRQDTFPAVHRLTRWMFAEPMQIDGRHGLDLIIGGAAEKNSPGARSVLGWLQAPPSPAMYPPGNGTR